MNDFIRTAQALVAGDKGLLVMVDPMRCEGFPWARAFSFGRAIQEPALDIWHGDHTNVAAVQNALRHRARCDRAVRRGEYRTELEVEDAAP